MVIPKSSWKVWCSPHLAGALLVFLGIPLPAASYDLYVRKLGEHPDYNELYIGYGQERICPHCGSSHCVIKDSGRECRVCHTPYNGRTAHLIFHRRRLLCRDCRRSFMELPCWLHPSLHITQTLYLNICPDLTDMLPISAAAIRNGVPPETVTAVMGLILFQPPQRLPKVLCMDEFKGDSGSWDAGHKRWDTHKYHASLVDGGPRAVIDILPDIRSAELMEYFRRFSPDERARVQFFAAICTMGSSGQLYPWPCLQSWPLAR